MRVCIEWVDYKRIGIVRAGRICYGYRKPYDYTVLVVRPKYRFKECTIKALVADGGFKNAHKKAMFAKVRQYFPVVRWERVRSLTQRDTVLCSK